MFETQLGTPNCYLGTVFYGIFSISKIRMTILVSKSSLHRPFKFTTLVKNKYLPPERTRYYPSQKNEFIKDKTCRNNTSTAINLYFMDSPRKHSKLLFAIRANASLLDWTFHRPPQQSAERFFCFPMMRWCLVCLLINKSTPTRWLLLLLLLSSCTCNSSTRC